MPVERQPLAWLERDVPDADPFVLEEQPRPDLDVLGSCENGPQLVEADVPAAADERHALSGELLAEAERGGERRGAGGLDEVARPFDHQPVAVRISSSLTSTNSSIDPT